MYCFGEFHGCVVVRVRGCSGEIGRGDGRGHIVNAQVEILTASIVKAGVFSNKSIRDVKWPSD